MNSSNDNKKQILLVAVAAILLAGLIFLLVLSTNKGGKPEDDRPGGRGGQPVRPTGPAPPGAPSPTVPIDPEDPNGKNVTPTPSGENGGKTTVTPGGGNGGDTTPTPGGGNGGDTTPTPGGGNGGNGGDTTPTPSGGNGGNTTPTPSGGNGGDTTPTPSGGNGGNTTPTPSGGNGGNTTPTPSGGNGGNTTPTPSGGNGGNTTPTPSGGNGGNTTPTPSGGNGGNTTPTPTRIPGWDVTPTPTAGPDGPTPTPRIGGPTPTPRPGGGSGGRTTPTPTPYGGNDKPTPAYIDPDGRNGGDSGLNAYDIANQDDSYLRSGVNFGDDRWDQYINGLFVRVSPDYSVDALTTLDTHGQELFMQMAEQFDNGKVTRAAQSAENQKIWDQITEEIHEATNRSQLEEIIIKYSLRFSHYRQYEPSWDTFNNGLYASDDARRTALLKSDCYMIVVGMQERMPKKGLGYSWNEALTVVLRESGKPMAQAASSEDDIELFMKLGRIFDGASFDTLDYAKKRLWWSIEEEVNKAQDIERLEELIVLYKANAEQRVTFQAILEKYPGADQAKNRRTAVQASGVYKDLIGTAASPGTLRKNFAIMGTQYATWEDALAAVLKNRVTVGGEVNAGGQKTETTLIE